MAKVWAKDAAGRKVLVPEHWLTDPTIVATGIAPVKVTPGEASAIIATKAREGEKEARNA